MTLDDQVVVRLEVYLNFGEEEGQVGPWRLHLLIETIAAAIAWILSLLSHQQLPLALLAGGCDLHLKAFYEWLDCESHKQTGREANDLRTHQNYNWRQDVVNEHCTQKQFHSLLENNGEIGTILQLLII